MSFFIGPVTLQLVGNSIGLSAELDKVASKIAGVGKVLGGSIIGLDIVVATAKQAGIDAGRAFGLAFGQFGASPGGLVSGITGAVASIPFAIGATVKAIGGFATGFSVMALGVPNIVEGMVKSFAKLSSTVVVNFGIMTYGAFQFFSALTPFLGLIPKIASVAIGALAPISSYASSAFSSVLSLMGRFPTITNTVQAIGKAFSYVSSVASSAFSSIKVYAQTAFIAASFSVSAFLMDASSLLGKISPIASKVFGSISSFIGSYVTSISGFLGKIDFTKLLSGFLNMGKGLVGFLGPVIGIVSGLISLIPIAGALVGSLVMAVGGIVTAASSALGALGSFVGGVVDTILSATATGAQYLGKFAIEAIKLYAQIEQSQIAFSTLFRSEDKGKKAVDDLRQYAAVTPFTSMELIESARQLAGYGTSAENLLGTIKLLGQVSAGTAVPIKDLSYLFGTLMSQGRAYTIDIRQFAGRGVPIWEYLQKVTKTTNLEIHQMVKDGQIGISEVLKAFQMMNDPTHGIYGGLIEKQGQSILGLFSTIKDNIEIAMANFGEELVDAFDLRTLMKDMIEGFDQLPALVKSLKPDIVDFADALKASFNLARESGKYVVEVFSILKDLILGTTTTKLGAGFTDWASNVKVSWEEAENGAIGFLKATATVIGKIVDQLKIAAGYVVRVAAGIEYGASGKIGENFFRSKEDDKIAADAAETLRKKENIANDLIFSGEQGKSEKEANKIADETLNKIEAIRKSRRKLQEEADAYANSSAVGSAPGILGGAFGSFSGTQFQKGQKDFRDAIGVALGGLVEGVVDTNSQKDVQVTVAFTIGKDVEDKMGKIKGDLASPLEKFESEMQILNRTAYALASNNNVISTFLAGIIAPNAKNDYMRAIAFEVQEKFKSSLENSDLPTAVLAGTKEAIEAISASQRQDADKRNVIPTQEQILEILKQTKKAQEEAAKQQVEYGKAFLEAYQEFQKIGLK